MLYIFKEPIQLESFVFFMILGTQSANQAKLLITLRLLADRDDSFFRVYGAKYIKTVFV